MNENVRLHDLRRIADDCVSAGRQVDKIRAERDELIMRLLGDGFRVADVAKAANVSRQAVYDLRHKHV